MNLNKNTLIYKWALIGWELTQRLTVLDDFYKSEMPKIMSLCQFVRIVFLWPAIYLMLVILALSPYGFALYDAYTSFDTGLATWLLIKHLSYLIGGFSLCAVIFFCISYIFRLFKEEESYSERKQRYEDGKYTTKEIICKYYAAYKSKFCPMITMKDD